MKQITFPKVVMTAAGILAAVVILLGFQTHRTAASFSTSVGSPLAWTYLATTTYAGSVIVGNGTFPNAFYVHPYFRVGSTTCPQSNITGFLEICGNDNTVNGIQFGVGNGSAGNSAYSGIYFNNDSAADNTTTHYGFVGYTSSTFNDTTYGTAEALPALLLIQSTDGPISLFASSSTAPTRAVINFFTSGTTAGAKSQGGNEAMRIDSLGRVGIGTTTLASNFQVAAASTNSTTTIELGMSAQTKGTCIKLYRTDGSAIYAYVLAGATSFTLSATANICSSVTGF